MIYNTKRTLFKFAVINLFVFLVATAFYYFQLDNWIYLVLFLFVLVINLAYLNKFVANPLYLITKEVAALLAGTKYSKISYKSDDEFGLISSFFNQVTKNLESVSQYLKEGSRMASELALASQIQRSVLPSSIPIVPKLDIIAKTRPAEEVGGDSFDINLKDGQYYFYIGDVTGHGAPACLVMMMVNTLFDVFLPVVSNTKELAVKINAELKHRVNSSLFMTTSFFRWNPVSTELFYTGAGHEHIIIYRANEGICEVFPAGGIALAMAEDITEIVSEKLIRLNPQDIMVLYSDGITEAVSPTGELFGLERLKASISKSGHLANSLDLFEAISAEVQGFTQNALQKDDMTLIVLRYINDEVFNPERVENLVSTKWNES
jgi:sigma-B regulation protein RsbU (phosphoserine phosphatase)